jgi:DNA-directed RNA polymerase specialized sigma24 family protein
VPAGSRAEAVRLYGEGWSCQRLAERYGCNATTVWKLLQQAGVRMRASWERP